MLDSYLTRWNLAHPQHIASTPTSEVYSVTYQDEITVLKLLTPIGIHDEQGGAVALSHFDGHGAVRLLKHDDKARLLEYADGDDLIPYVEEGKDDKATQIIVRVLNQLHAKPPPAQLDGLTTLRRRFRSLFRKAESEDKDSIYFRARQVAEEILAQPRDICVLHGDMHHENAIHSSQRGWLAIDPKGLIGERTFDCANALCNPISMPTLVQNENRLLQQASIFSEQLQIPRQRILAFTFAYACLSACWSNEDSQDETYALSMAQLAEPHLEFN